MGQLGTAVCWICILTTLVHAAFAYVICPDQNSTASPRFTKPLNTEEYAYKWKLKNLVCCAEGYDSIAWTYHHNNKWEPLPPPRVSTADREQILELNNVTSDYNTTFRCELIKNGNVADKHEVKLIVNECYPDPKGPVFTKPSAVNQTIYNYGEDVTFFCNGYFGCSTGGPRFTLWRVDGDEITNISLRYTVVTGENPNKTEKGSNLTITSVQAQDTERIFTCILYNRQGQRSTSVRIIKKEKPIVPDIVRLIGLTVGGVLGGILLLVLMMCCVKKLYGPQIKLFCSVTCPCGSENLTDEEKFDHNVLVYTADDDQEVAEELKKQLIELNYKVFFTTDVTPGQIRLSTIEREARRSAVMVFLYSENLKLDDWAHIFLYEFIEQRKEIIILEIGTVTYQPDTVMVKAKDVKNKRITGELMVNDDSIEMDNDGGNAIAQRDNCMKTRIDDVKFWKRLPKVKVPLKSDSNRKKVNFLCELQNRIPKFLQGKKKGSLKSKLSNSSIGRISKGRNSSSGRPLLPSDPNSPASPPISPSSDNVFHYEGETTPARLVGEENGTDSNIETNPLAVGLNGPPSRTTKSTQERHPVYEIDHEMCAEIEVQFPRQQESQNCINEREEHVIVNPDVHLRLTNPAITRNFTDQNEIGIEGCRNVADTDKTELLSVYPSSRYNETLLPVGESMNAEQMDVTNRPSLSMQTELKETRIGNRPSLSKGDSSDASDLVSPVSTGLFPFQPQSVSSGFSESSFEQSGQSTQDMQPGESDSDYNSGQLGKCGQLSEGGYSLEKGYNSGPIKSKPLDANSIDNHTGTKDSDRNQTDAKLVGRLEYNLGSERNGRLNVHIPGDGNRPSGGSLSDIGSAESGYNTSRDNSIQNHVLNHVGRNG